MLIVTLATLASVVDEGRAMLVHYCARLESAWVDVFPPRVESYIIVHIRLITLNSDRSASAYLLRLMDRLSGHGHACDGRRRNGGVIDRV